MPTKLGQNFLKNKEIVKKIVQSADLTPDDFVLEIGPGKGILTEELAKYAGKIVAVELDCNLANLLKNKFKAQENIEIIEGDILKINLINLIDLIDLKKSPSLMTKKLQAVSYKLIANLPYYITSPIIRLFLESENPPKEMILMVQKEVAERIVAKPGRMSILAVSVQYYAEPKILFYVGKENFDPIPEVDSAIIHLTRNTNHVTKEERNAFFRIVRAGFSAKRKTLVNNLANCFHLEKGEIEEILEKIGIKKSSRAQELSIIEWEKITKFLLAKSQK